MTSLIKPDKTAMKRNSQREITVCRANYDWKLKKNCEEQRASISKIQRTLHCSVVDLYTFVLRAPLQLTHSGVRRDMEGTS